MSARGSWTKRGQLFSPSTSVEPGHPKLVTHAANPLAVHLSGDVYRVFFSGRDAENRSSVSYADLDLSNMQITRVAETPVFQHGPDGCFYSHGVSFGCAYEAGGRKYIGFMGWQVPTDGHWRGDIGRLELHPDFTTTIDGTGRPVLGISEVDPVSLSYPWVMPNPEGGYHMWYGSTVSWDAGNGEMLHVINHATSSDGHKWHLHGLAIPFQLGKAQAFSRPSVIQNHDGSYEMWFSYRGGLGTTYRIGHAYSRTGFDWVVSDRAGIDVSRSGWDSEMIEYPFVFDHDGQRYMLYNGNGYGLTGLGIAVLET